MDPNAVQDILNNPRYEGMMSTISGVTGFVDGIFMTVITFVAFFIISVALLRNVLAGAYCAFPKFWDQVAFAHEQNKDKAFFEQIKGIKDSYKTASMSSLKTLILRIVPNIKCLTDFEGNTINKKDYFIRAIPEMIAVVIIGVFIYNGYYRDFTSKVADAGSQLIDRAILSFDPIGTFDNMLNTAGRPSFATDDSIDQFNKNKNKVAVEIYSQIISRYTDIKDANSKAEIASQIDAVVDQMFPEDYKSWFGAEDGSYDVTIKVDTLKQYDPTKHMSGELNSDKFVRSWCIGIGKEGSATASKSFDESATLRNITFDSTVDAINEEWVIAVAVQAQRHAVKTQVGGAAYADITIGVEGGDFYIYDNAYTKNIVITDAKGNTYQLEATSWDSKTQKVTYKASALTKGEYTVTGTAKLRAINPAGGGVDVYINKVHVADGSASITASEKSGWDLTGGTTSGNILNATKKTTQTATVPTDTTGKEGEEGRYNK